MKSNIPAPDWKTEPLYFLEDFNVNRYSVVALTVNSVGNSIIDVTSTTSDPNIYMASLGSFNPAIYKYIVIKYKYVSGTGTAPQIYYFNDAGGASGDRIVIGTNYINDGEWHVMSIDMSVSAKWLDSFITGWRFDCINVSGTRMQFDYVMLSSIPYSVISRSWPLLRNHLEDVRLSGGRQHKVVAYTHGATVGAGNSYLGLTLNADGSRIYFIPHAQADVSVWHYIDTTTGAVVAYTHGATAVDSAYYGGILATNGRIYMVPWNQYGQTVWHYIDTDGTVVAYTHGATCVAAPYLGGVVQPNTGRIYLVPYTQSTATVWHYIDTNGTVVAYTHGATCTATAYQGAVVQPNTGRIYLIPSGQGTATVWHYIDTNGTVVAYTHGATFIGSSGGALHPTTGRIYFAPNNVSATNWYYIDTDGSVVAYSRSASVPMCIGATTAPNGRIYFIPVSTTTCTYIDIDGLPKEFSITDSVINWSGCLAPNGRIYMAPRNNGTATTWRYIDTRPNVELDVNAVTSPYFNKF